MMQNRHSKGPVGYRRGRMEQCYAHQPTGSMADVKGCWQADESCKKGRFFHQYFFNYRAWSKLASWCCCIWYIKGRLELFDQGVVLFSLHEFHQDELQSLLSSVVHWFIYGFSYLEHYFCLKKNLGKHCIRTLQTAGGFLTNQLCYSAAGGSFFSLKAVSWCVTVSCAWAGST